MKSFGWDLIYDCNYRCQYCRIYKEKEHSSGIIPLAKWEEAWERIFRIYSECSIFLSGGEPSVYPDFYELIKILTPMHIVNICTNLSFDPEKLHLDNKILISATFHPFNANSDEFVNKIVSLREYLDRVNFLLYPGEVQNFLSMREKLLLHNIPLHPIPARSFDEQPMNSPEELTLIREYFLDDSDESEEQLGFLSLKTSPAGRLCRAGYSYAMIRPDGFVTSCPLMKEEGLGSIFSKDFKFLEKPKICTSEKCFIPSLIIKDER